MRKYTFGQKCADLVAKFGGSWKFIFVFAIFLSSWVLINLFLLHPVDPYPFIFLNLMLSMLAAIQAPFIMMSSNRQMEKDRERDDHDFKLDKDTNRKVRKIEEDIAIILKKIEELD